MLWLGVTHDWLWRNALAVVPLTILVLVLCRLLPLRSSTRHALWVVVLLSLVAPPLLPGYEIDTAIVPAVATPAANPVGKRVQPRTQAPVKSAVDVARVQPRAANPVQTVVEPSWASAPQANTSVAIPVIVPSDDAECEAAQKECEVAAQECETIQRQCLEIPALSGDDAALIASMPEPRIPAVSGPVIDEAVQFGDRLIAPRTPFVTADASPAMADAKPESARSAEAPAELVTASQAQLWFAKLLAVVDAIRNVPPLPASVWLAGVILMLLVTLLNLWRFRIILKSAQPAPVDVREMVLESAVALNLRTVVHPVMVPHRVSPMVWCGRHPRLVLPANLWETLDDPSRRAVILHELAHLRRRDHWVCRLSVLIGIIYWWHPLVWFCGRRLREEADLSCDSWVTALLPRARRAYAQALLATRSFISQTPSNPVPVMGLGMTTPRAQRFARRLTMVMTNQSGPRVSRLGLVAVLCVAAGALLSTPLWACPPEDCQEQPAPKVKVKVRTPQGLQAPQAPSAPRTPRAPRPAQPGEDDTTYERFMERRGGGMSSATPAPGYPGAEAPAAYPLLLGAYAAGESTGGVEQRIEHLERRLDELAAHLEHMLAGGGHAEVRAMLAPEAEVRAAQAYDHLRKALAERSLVETRVAEAMEPSGETISKMYHLPEGKLQAMIELMKREDVPVLITAHDDAIEVHATPAQHEIFGMFVRLINPDGASMIDDRAAQELALVYGDLGRRRLNDDLLLKVERLADLQGLGDLESLMAQMEAVRASSVELEAAAAELEAQADALEEEADALSEQAEEVEDGADRQSLLQQAKELMKQSKVLAKQAAELDAQAEQAEEHADALEEKSEAWQEHIEEAEEAAAEAEAQALEAERAAIEAEEAAEAEAAEEARDAAETAA